MAVSNPSSPVTNQNIASMRRRYTAVFKRPNTHSYFVKGDNEPKAFGVDIAITRSYNSATHGQRSHIVSIGEKYVWCAKNEILGYLADRLPFSNFSDDGNRLDDYIKLESVRMPFDYSACAPGECSDSRLVLSSRLKIGRGEVGVNCENIVNWIVDDDTLVVDGVIDGELFCDRGFSFEPVPLSVFYHVEMWGVERCVWSSACAVPKEMVEPLENKLISDEQFCKDFFEVDRICAYVESDCYVTPQEICASPWRDELCSFKGDVSDEGEECNSIVIYMSNLDCVSSVDSEGDVFFTIPSKLFREMLGVDSCDGRCGYDAAGNFMFEYRSAGEVGDEVVRQALYADTAVLSNQLERRGFELLWFVRVLKREAIDAHDHGLEGSYENDRLYIVRLKDGVVKTQMLQQDIFNSTERDNAAKLNQTVVIEELPEWLREISQKRIKNTEDSEQMYRGQPDES